MHTKQILYILLVGTLLMSPSLQAQCAMCRAALESEESGVQARAVNDGIVYLMAIPYIFVAVIGYFIYRLKFGKKQEKNLTKKASV